MDGLTSQAPSSGVSVSSRSNHPPISIYGVDPPRPPKEGYEWVWFPDGYWAEREIRQVESPTSKTLDLKRWKRRRRSAKSQSGGGGSSQEGDQPQTISPKTILSGQWEGRPSIPQPPQSPYLTEEAHVQSLQNPPPLSPDQDEREREWLTPKHRAASIPAMLLSSDTTPTKPITSASSESHHQFPTTLWKGLGVSRQRTKEKKKSATFEVGPLTDAALDAVNNYLDQIPDAKPEEAKPETTANTGYQGAPKGRRIRFTRRSWHHHKEPIASAPIPAEATGKPRGEATSMGALLAHPLMWSSQFPSGEATRVHTPPLKEDTADGKPRGLFFDVSGPNDQHGSSESTSSTRGTRSSQQQHRKDKASSSKGGGSSKGGSSTGGGSSEPKKSREWWDTPSKASTTAAAQAAARRNSPMRKAALFEFDLPEHLPNSPMCPANVKNKSEGKGICVYHGRRKSAHRSYSTGDSPGFSSQVGGREYVMWGGPREDGA